MTEQNKAPSQEPVAFYDTQTRMFAWATPREITGVPVSVKVDPIPLYSHPAPSQEPDPVICSRCGVHKFAACNCTPPDAAAQIAHWEAEAKRYCQNADYWRDQIVKLEEQLALKEADYERCKTIANATAEAWRNDSIDGIPVDAIRGYMQHQTEQIAKLEAERDALKEALEEIADFEGNYAVYPLIARAALGKCKDKGCTGNCNQGRECDCALS